MTATDSTNPLNGGQTASGASSPITVSGLTNGDSYTFTVTATNANGTGPASDPSNAVTPSSVPDAPTAATATAGNTSASVSFTPGSDEGSTITSYTVTASDSTTPANGGQTASGASSPITVSGLTNGDSYTFTVTATNANGTGPASDPSNAVTPSTVPDAPTAATATAGNGSASVAFTPGGDEGSTITGYTVTANDSTTPANGGQTASGASSPITVGSLTNGDSYTFTVTAANANGTGPASDPSHASDAIDGARRTDGSDRHRRQRLGLGRLHAGLRRGLDDHQLHGDRQRQHDAGQRRPDRLGQVASLDHGRRPGPLTVTDTPSPSPPPTPTAPVASLGSVQRGDAGGFLRGPSTIGPASARPLVRMAKWSPFMGPRSGERHRDLPRRSPGDSQEGHGHHDQGVRAERSAQRQDRRDDTRWNSPHGNEVQGDLSPSTFRTGPALASG